MKKILKLIFLISIFSLALVGCGVKSADNVIDKIAKKQKNSTSYYVKGTMEIVNNEDTYKYNVEVSYKKKDYYKVELVNTLNNHEQVILRNDDGVYVVTPSLNKSFKFQSDWPYNNSQIYLLGSIIEDLTEDEDRVFKTKNDGYYFQSSVDYPNNKSLVKQNVYVDKDYKITKVEVTNKEGKVQITMNFDKVIYNKKYASDYFELSKLINVKEENNNSSTNKSNSDKTTTQNQDQNRTTDEKNNSTGNNVTNNNANSNTNNNTNNNTSSNNTTTNNNHTTNDKAKSSEQSQTENNQKTESSFKESKSNTKTKTKKTATIDDVIYPMYLPTNTTLANKEVINTKDGQRLILTFEGDNPFVLVEETISYADEGLIIPVSGSLDFLTDVIGVINDHSVSFDSNGIGYYIVSDKLNKTELVNIARSISVLPVSK